MECNKDEAKRAMDIAEKKLSENDYVGAKKFVSKAQNLYPQLDGLKQVSMMIHVYISAAIKINGGRETDWYGVLGVDPLADDEALKKQYKKLALLLHPDKNKCKGAEGAFKLVLNAWYLLSDKVKRTAFDQKRKLNTGMQKQPPNQPKPASSNGHQNASRDGVHPSAKARSNHPASGPQKPLNPHKPAFSSVNQNARAGVHPSANTRSNKPAPAPAPAPAPEPANSSKQRKDDIFWTMCNGCKTRSQLQRDCYLNKNIACLNCDQAYIATEQNPWDRYVSYFDHSLSLLRQRQQQWSAQNQETNKNTNGASSSGTSSSPFVGATDKSHLWESYVTRVNYTLSFVRQRQQQWNAKNQAENKNTNGSSTSRTSSSPNVGATGETQERFQQVYLAFSLLLKLQRHWSAHNQAANNNGRSSSPSVSATGKAPHASVVRPDNLSSSSPQQQQQQQQWSAKSQATNTYTNGASSFGRNSSPFVSATQETPHPSAKSQETNKNTNGASSSGRGISSPYVSATAKTPPGSFMWSGINLSSSPQQQQQQWQHKLQQQWGAQNTSGGTYYPSSSGSSHQNCSVSVTASSNSGNAANQTQDTSKRGLEDSQETLDAAERLFKKQRTDVR